MVQCSAHTQHSQLQLSVDGKNFEVVSADVGFKVLGTTFALKNGTQKELNSARSGGGQTACMPR